MITWLAAREEARARRGSRLSRPSYLHGTLVADLVATTVVVAVAPINKIFIEGDWRPDVEAAQFVLQSSPHTRVLTWFDWGEYAIWQLSPAGIQVSMDGRRETVYSERVLQDHFNFYNNVADGWRYPTTIGADRIWLPKQLAIVPVLQKHGWHAIYQNSRSIVLAPDGYAGPPGTDSASATYSSRSTSGSTSESVLFPGS
jgi:hypothetical protein